MLFLNLKAYKEAIGQKSLDLARLVKRCANRFEVDTVLLPSQQDLGYLLKNVPQDRHFKIFAQHADVSHAGAFTGSVSVEALHSEGALGFFLNHAEKKIPRKKISALVEASKFFGLKSVVCAKNVSSAVAIEKLCSPWAIAIEIPELIGTGVSISSVRPEAVTAAVKKIKEKNPSCFVLAGAGVSSGADVKKARELGADGVVLSSRFVHAVNHEEKLAELLSGFKG